MGEEKKKYRLDKTAFQAMNVEEADTHYSLWKNKFNKERLEAGCYLIEQFYGVTSQTAIDKAIFTKRKHTNG
jgi:hypothetical protein